MRRRGRISAGHGASGLLSRVPLGPFGKSTDIVVRGRRGGWIHVGAGERVGFLGGRRSNPVRSWPHLPPSERAKKPKRCGTNRGSMGGRTGSVRDQTRRMGIRTNGRSVQVEWWKGVHNEEAHQDEGNKESCNAKADPEKGRCQWQQVLGMGTGIEIVGSFHSHPCVTPSRQRTQKAGSRCSKHKQTTASAGGKNRSLCSSGDGRIQISQVPLDLASGCVVHLVVKRCFHHGPSMHRKNASATHGTVCRSQVLSSTCRFLVHTLIPFRFDR